MGPGDAVRQYDPLCRVQSDKATIDVTSAYDGTIRSLSVRAGDVLAVGEPLCVVSADGPGASTAGASLSAPVSTIVGDPSPDDSPRRKLTSYRRSMMHAMQQVRANFCFRRW